jgi:hypothetical protein
MVKYVSVLHRFPCLIVKVNNIKDERLRKVVCEMLLRIRYDDRRIVAPTTSVTKEDITTRLLIVYKFPQSEALTLCVEIIWSNNRRSEYLFISSIVLNYHSQCT